MCIKTFFFDIHIYIILLLFSQKQSIYTIYTRIHMKYIRERIKGSRFANRESFLRNYEPVFMIYIQIANRYLY